MMNLFLKSPKFSGNFQNDNFIESPVKDPFRESAVKMFAQVETAWVGFGAAVSDFFKSYQWREVVFTLKTISLILCLLMVLLVIYIFFKRISTGLVVKEKKKIIFNKKKIAKKWAKIEKKIKTGTEANYKLAILEADALYDDVLKILGSETEKMAINIGSINLAKKVKKKIVDDPSFLLGKDEAEQSIHAYKKGLEDLGAI